MTAQSKSVTNTMLEQLRDTLPGKGRVLIVPHDYPDPDALAGAACLYLLLKTRWKLQPLVAYSGMVSRAENLEVLKHYKCSWKQAGLLRPKKGKIPAIFVDTTPWSGNVTVHQFVEPVAVFDHHTPSRSSGKHKLPFMDLVPGIGAICTRMHDYLEVADIAVPSWLATLIVYAITVETFDFLHQSSARDMEVFGKLMPLCNPKMLGAIRHAPLPRIYYSLLEQALANMHTHANLAWTHIPAVEKPEIVAEVADLLLRMERVTWSFCTAIMNGNRIVFSLRSSKSRAQCGKLLRKAVGKDGDAGGHRNSAAGSIDAKNLSRDQRDAKLSEFTSTLIKAVVPGHTLPPDFPAQNG